MPENKEREDAEKDIKDYAALDAFATSEAGAVIRASLIRDLASTVDALGGQFKTVSHVELVAMCAQLSDRIAILRSFSRAAENRDAARAFLDEMTS